MSVASEKALLRQGMRKARSSLPFEVRERARLLIGAALEALHAQHHGLVAAYAPTRDEASPLSFVWSLEARGEDVAWPRVHGDELRFHRCAYSELVPGFRGLLEPPLVDEIPLSEVAMMLVPGLAFDRAGHRLGQGGGFYDRVLPQVGGLRVGVCFSVQRVESLPRLAHDIPVDLVLSPA